MSQQKLTGGGMLDLLTASEMHTVMRTAMQSWYREACTGTTFRRFTVQGTITGANTLDMGGGRGEAIGPADGFVWDVRRLHISGLNIADVIALGINDNQPASLIATSADYGATQVRTWNWASQLVLMPKDSLKIYGSGLVATSGVVTVSGQVRELPTTQLWRLGGN